ncbi:three-Cys-motif partner protein TcmP [Streptomyces sp. NPDC004082]|uniref:three-Cys-motif partner protein TcmP n=1 Tax=Streptomyces sp. NPDC005481 TaxID=3154881 RepID=UPI0033B8AAEF
MALHGLTHAAKDKLCQRYLDAWWPAMLQTSRNTGLAFPRVTLLRTIDGPAHYDEKEPLPPILTLDRLLHHSASQQMNLSRRRAHMVVIARERESFENVVTQLRARFGSLADLPVRVEVRCGDAARDTLPVLTGLGAWGNPILGLFDSLSGINIPLEVMRRIAHNRASEAIVAFGPHGQKPRYTGPAHALDSAFGGRTPREAAAWESRPEESWRAWLNGYGRALRPAGFAYRLKFRMTAGNRPPLHLVFATSRLDGVSAMKDVITVSHHRDGVRFHDPRNAATAPAESVEPVQVNGEVNPELAELVIQRLAGGSLSVEGIGKWLLTETALWLPAHAQPAVQVMLEDGTLVKQSVRKLSRRSLIDLPGNGAP